ncbi:uncharacterized protein stbd1 [Entelurus aequoreus]|uniref:uncharacterized protein stbd1 n=1 Tax=Entelurus aequoreus TaxID=161455 RepID=UPI002B1DE8B4|nr:uncharacterized protein stbd1 [Entelurus aequoreus]
MNETSCPPVTSSANELHLQQQQEASTPSSRTHALTHALPPGSPTDAITSHRHPLSPKPAMGLTGSDGVAVERRVDLASLFCMIGRHGPAVALAVFAVVSVLAGYVIYRAVRRRKTEEVKLLPAGGDESAQAGLEAARAAASTEVADDNSLELKQEDEETETQPQVRQRRAAAERDSWLCSPPQTDIRAPVSHHDTSPRMQTVQSWSMEPDVVFEEPGLALQSAVAEVQEEDAEVCSSGARVDAVKDEEVPRSSLVEPPEVCHEEHDQPHWDLVTDEGISKKNSTQEGNLPPWSQVVYLEEPLVLEEYADQDKQDIGSPPETETVELNTTHTSLNNAVENVNRHQNNVQEEERTNEVIQAEEGDEGDRLNDTAVDVDAQSEEHSEQEDHSLTCDLETDVLQDEPVEGCQISVSSGDKPSVPVMLEELVDELVSRITSDALGSFPDKSTNDQPRKVEVPTLDEDVEPPMPSDQSQSATGMTENGSTTVEDEEPVEHMSIPHVLVDDDQQSVQEVNQFEPPMTSAEVQNMIENDSTTEDKEPVEHMSIPHVLGDDDHQSAQEMNQFEPLMTSAEIQNMIENDSTTVEDEEPVEHMSKPHVLGDDDHQSAQEMNQFEPPITSAEVQNMIENDSTTVEDEEPVEHMSIPHVLGDNDHQSAQEMNQFEPPMTSAEIQNMTENGSTTVEDEEPVEHMSKSHVLGDDDQQSVQEMNQFEPPVTSAQVQNMIEMIENDSTTVEDEEPVEHRSIPHVLGEDDHQSAQEMNQFEPPMTSAEVQNMIENDSTTVEDKEPVEHMSKPHVLVYDDQQSLQEMNQFEPPVTSAQVQDMIENGSTTVEDKEPVEHTSKPHVLVYDDQESIQETNQFEPSAKIQNRIENDTTTEDKEPVEHISKPHVLVYDDQESVQKTNQFEPPAQVQNRIETIANDSTTEDKEPVEHMAKPHMCPSAQEINNVNIIDTITEIDPSIQDLRVNSAVDTDARNQTFHKGISSQDQQNVQIEDFSFVVIDPSPDMTLPLFMPSDLRDNDMTCGVGEESGISSMAVSPELTDPGNHFSAMELPVMDQEPPVKEKPETQTSLFADNASLSVIGEVEAAMGFEPQPDPLSDRSDRDSFTVNQVGDQRVEMRSDEQDGKVAESFKEKRDCAENRETEKDENFAKTEINIMEATMDHNEWITDSNQHLPWMNLTLPSFGQHHTADQLPTEEPKHTDSEPPYEVQQTHGLHVLHEKVGSRNVSVTFRVHYLTQSPFQKLAVTGNRPELGNWKGYVPLESAEDGHWAAAVSLPAKSLAQWKFVVVDQGEVCRWEECGNRLLDTGCGEDVLVHKFWGFL